MSIYGLEVEKMRGDGHLHIDTSSFGRAKEASLRS